MNYLIRTYAGLLFVIGLILLSGGAYLLTLHGSPYYLLCGIAMLGSALLLWRGARGRGGALRPFGSRNVYLGAVGNGLRRMGPYAADCSFRGVGACPTASFRPARPDLALPNPVGWRVHRRDSPLR
jgi:hypothetical protein